jgi:hypothetical protein
MPREWKLTARREDTQPIVRLGRTGRHQERRLRQVGPSGNGLHGVAVQAVGIEDLGDWIAQQWLIHEHVDYLAGLHRHSPSIPFSRFPGSCKPPKPNQWRSRCDEDPEFRHDGRLEFAP